MHRTIAYREVMEGGMSGDVVWAGLCVWEQSEESAVSCIMSSDLRGMTGAVADLVGMTACSASRRSSP